MFLFDLLLPAGLTTTALVAYLIFFRKSPTKRGPYRSPGWNYPLKLLVARWAVRRWKSQKKSKNRVDDLPRSINTSEGLDSITFKTSAPEGPTIYLGIRKIFGRRPLAELTLHIKLSDGSTYKLPQHPDTAIGAWDRADGCWSAGGLKIRVVEENERMRIIYNGLVTKVGENTTHHAKLNALWMSATSKVRHPEDWSSELAAEALALEPWRDGNWPNMLDRCDESSCVQWGAIQGRFEVYSQGVVSASEYLRVRGVKERCWSPRAYRGLRRVVNLEAAASDGTAVQLKAVGYKNVLTQCYSGCVRFPNYTVESITSTDLVMSDFCEVSDGLPKTYIINVTAKKRDLKVVLKINSDGGKLFSGVPYQRETFYRTIVVEINGEPGSGILELGYESSETIREPSYQLKPARVLEWHSANEVGPVTYCAPFESRVAACPDYVGGKGASLALLASVQKEEGYKVPPGFCLTTKALEKHLEMNPKLKMAILEIEAAAENYDEAHFKETCTRTSQLISETEITGEIKEEILLHLNELNSKALEQGLGPEVRFAVRSSAVGEDSEALSAAGQNETVLGCAGRDVVRGVQRCWGSMFAYISAHYRRQNGQPCLCGGGVVVQALVRPRAAGVLFTRQPAAGDPARLTITANYGLGESVVSGAVEPDTIEISRSAAGLSIASITLGSKLQRVSAAGEGVKTEEVAAAERAVPCLGEQEALRLAALGEAQEALWAAPRDIEWAVCGVSVEERAGPCRAEREARRLAALGEAQEALWAAPRDIEWAVCGVSVEERAGPCRAEREARRLAALGEAQEALWAAPRDVEWAVCGVSVEERAGPCRAEREARRLAALGEAQEALWAAPRDIEWAVCGVSVEERAGPCRAEREARRLAALGEAQEALWAAPRDVEWAVCGVSVEERAGPCRAEREARRLAALGEAQEALWAAPRDIEWAVCGVSVEERAGPCRAEREARRLAALGEAQEALWAAPRDVEWAVCGVSVEERAGPCRAEREARRLAALGEAQEALWAAPRDIEWAVCGVSVEERAGPCRAEREARRLAALGEAQEALWGEAQEALWAAPRDVEWAVCGVSVEERAGPCRAEREARRLTALGEAQEAQWTSPRDIEWAVCGDDIYLLQARPITALERWTEEELLHELDFPIMADDELLTFGNIGEVLPKPVSPLALDLVLRPLQTAIEEMFGGDDAGYNRSIVVTHARCAMAMYNSLYRRVSHKMDVSLRMVEMAVHGHKVADEQMFSVALHRRPPHWTDKILAIGGLIMNMFMTKRKLNDTIKLVDRMTIDSLEAEEPGAYLEALFAQKGDLKRCSHNHVCNTAASSGSQFFAMLVLLEGGQDFSTEQCNEISKILSSGDVLSAEVPQSLDRLARKLASSGKVEEFRQQPPSAALAWLREHLTEIYVDVMAFLDAHGHRCVMEFDLASKPWAIKSDSLMEVLQNMRPSKEEVVRHTKTDAEIIADLKTPKKSSTRKILSWLLPLCRRTVRHREGTKAHLILAVHKMRLAVRRLARLMVKQWYLPDADLVYYFRAHELKEYLATRNPDLLRKATQRHQYFPWWAKLKFAELNRGWFGPLPAAAPRLAASGARVEATSVCGGETVARACVVKELSEIGQLQQGDVLITHSTDIGWSPYFPLVTGIVTELGGLISHGAVIAREYGLPCIVGAANATDIFKTGDMVRLSGTHGVLEKVEVAPTENRDTSTL